MECACEDDGGCDVCVCVCVCVCVHVCVWRVCVCGVCMSACGVCGVCVWSECVDYCVIPGQLTCSAVIMCVHMLFCVAS